MLYVKILKMLQKKDLEKEFKIKKYDLDLLSGGAPCQSFSYAGKRLGLEDVRGTMFYHYATFLNKLQPKIFLFENVKGLLSHDKGRTFSTICNVFEEQGYSIQYKILNAWDYNVAQKRERLFIVGIRKDLSNTYVFNFPQKYKYKPVLKDILKDVPNSECAQYSEAKKNIFKLVPPGGYWKDIDENIAKSYMKSCWDMGGGRTGILRRLSLDEPSLTVLTTPQMKQTDRCHPIEVRPFSIRENARIQSFPDDWIFAGSIVSQYKQIGNAVPVNLAKEIGLEIVKTLNNKESDGVEMCFNCYCNDIYNLNFISQHDFENHVQATLNDYQEILQSIDLKKFNSNIVDPIKLLFDKNVFNKTFEEIIEMEIHRQRDKSNNNSIGYFHQNIFKYIKNCYVPKNGEEEGWDIIFEKSENLIYYIEMKNKHNTMNSSSSKATYSRMQNHLLTALDKENSICAVVEIISKKSSNIPWAPTFGKYKHSPNERLRRISIDKFYEIVTGDKYAFKNLCYQLPITIEKILKKFPTLKVQEDSVIDELKLLDNDILIALYKLAFSAYEGFNF